MQYPTISEYFAEAQKIIARKRSYGKPEFPTGLTFLDDLTGGMSRGEIWVISGKTGSGKTALALQMANNFAKDKKHSVLFLTLELKGWQMLLRMFSEMNSIDHTDLEQGRMDFDEKQVKDFNAYLEQIDFEIVEGGYIFAELQKIIYAFYEKKHPDIIFMDFIQLIEWKSFENERIAIMEYIRKIKEMANKLGIGFVIVSQLRRLPSGADYNRPPDLFDLMGSGSLEQMADKVVFLYKAITEDRKLNLKTEKFFLNLAKNRQGRTAQQEVFFEGQFYRFTDPYGIKPDEESDKVKDYFNGKEMDL